MEENSVAKQFALSEFRILWMGAQMKKINIFKNKKNIYIYFCISIESKETHLLVLQQPKSKMKRDIFQYAASVLII